MTQNHLAAVLDRLQTETVGDADLELDELSTGALAGMMNDRDSAVVAAVRDALPSISAAIDAIVERMRRGARLIYVGAGTSGRLGVLDASEIPPTFGTDDSVVLGLIAGGPGALTSAAEGVEDDADAGADDLAAVGLTVDDVVVGIASSGRTPYVMGAVAYAAGLGALTVGVSCNLDVPLTAAVEHGIEIAVGPEFVTGSTRLGAGTATKMVLNMISTITMIRLGKTYRTLMVDLRVSNEKLAQRAVRMVRLVTGVDEDTARATLESADWQVKTAIAMIATHRSAVDAHAALENADGVLRRVIDR